MLHNVNNSSPSITKNIKQPLFTNHDSRNGTPILVIDLPRVSTWNIALNIEASFWPTVLSVEPMVQYVVCLSVCLSSLCLSVTFCIVAKRCVLAKKCLKE